MLSSLTLENFRVVNAILPFSPKVNVVWGDNGSGKSSILEAIHYLAFGRSFRTSNTDMFIAEGASYAAIHAAIESNALPYSATIVRHVGKTQVKLSGDLVPVSKLSALLPALFMDCDSHRSYFSSRSYRLKLFDWLVFHVEPGYMSLVRKYNQALKQRNWCLKQGSDPSLWNEPLDQYAVRINALREKAFKLIAAESAAMFDEPKLALQYNPGYDVSQGLRESLVMARSEDARLRRTTVGPHKADFSLFFRGRAAGDVFSQGQQKTVFLKLLFAQFYVVRNQNKSPLILIDDLAAELDQAHQELVKTFLVETGAQAIVTTVFKETAKLLNPDTMFHVKQGVLV